MAVFTANNKFCARCKHWNGERSTISGFGLGRDSVHLVEANTSNQARCNILSLDRSATQQCTKYSPAFRDTELPQGLTGAVVDAPGYRGSRGF